MENPWLRRWLEEREPPIPAPFLPVLMETDQGSAGSEGLARWGLEALGRALERPGRDRDAAFHLLAADAFFTYACEAAGLERGTPERMEELLRLLGRRFPS